MKYTKHFKIGEYVVGGIIKVTGGDNIVNISFLDYTTKEVILKETFNVLDIGTRNKIFFYLAGCLPTNGTSYYADKVINFIETKVALNH
jgi:hypothetical protein|tara:strand:- start:30 stop:296 length:267 start_codon:yes stop_codon:yes gene_type:complete